MPIEQYTYWSVTVNNPDENDYLIVRNPNPKYIREMVWTPEVGAEGTPHIQAWVRLQRNQSLAFVKKLYPRAHIKPTDKDMYNENSHQYAQKNDDTTAGNHHITLNDPLPANDTVLYQVLERAAERAITITNPDLGNMWHKYGPQVFHMTELTLKKLDTDFIEREMIMERSGMEKLFVSPVYEKMKHKYWREILFRIYSHKQDALHESSGEALTQTSGTRGEEGSYGEDGETSYTERSSESGSVGSRASDDFEESGEQAHRKFS